MEHLRSGRTVHSRTAGAGRSDCPSLPRRRAAGPGTRKVRRRREYRCPVGSSMVMVATMPHRLMAPRMVRIFSGAGVASGCACLRTARIEPCHRGRDAALVRKISRSGEIDWMRAPVFTSCAVGFAVPLDRGVTFSAAGPTSSTDAVRSPTRLPLGSTTSALRGAQAPCSDSDAARSRRAP
jgi:hypothetical protein